MEIRHTQSLVSFSETELRALVLMARLWKNYAKGSRKELIMPTDLETEEAASRMADFLTKSP